VRLVLLPRFPGGPAVAGGQWHRTGAMRYDGGMNRVARASVRRKKTELIPWFSLQR
jgi:hypothetical protein